MSFSATTLSSLVQPTAKYINHHQHDQWPSSSLSELSHVILHLSVTNWAQFVQNYSNMSTFRDQIIDLTDGEGDEEVEVKIVSDPDREVLCKFPLDMSQHYSLTMEDYKRLEKGTSTTLWWSWSCWRRRTCRRCTSLTPPFSRDWWSLVLTSSGPGTSTLLRKSCSLSPVAATITGSWLSGEVASNGTSIVLLDR